MTEETTDVQEAPETATSEQEEQEVLTEEEAVADDQDSGETEPEAEETVDAPEGATEDADETDSGAEEVEEPSADEAPSLSAYDLSLARMVGLDEDDVAAMGEGGSAILEKMAARYTTQMTGSGVPQVAAPEAEKTAEPAPKPTPAPEAAAPTDTAFSYGVDFGELFEDEGTVDAFRQMETKTGEYLGGIQAQYKDQITQLEARAAEFETRMAQADQALGHAKRSQAQEAERVAGKFFQDLPEKYGDTYGRGTQITDAQKEQRTALYDQAEFVAQQVAASGRDIEFGELLHAGLFAHAAKSAPAQDVEDHKKKLRADRKKQVSPGTTSGRRKRSPLAKGKEAGIAAARESLNEIMLKKRNKAR